MCVIDHTPLSHPPRCAGDSEGHAAGEVGVQEEEEDAKRRQQRTAGDDARLKTHKKIPRNKLSSPSLNMWTPKSSEDETP